MQFHVLRHWEVTTKKAALPPHMDGSVVFATFRQYAKLCDGAQMAIFGDFFASCISASRVQHVSDLHPKFALRPHHVWKYGRQLFS